MFKKIIFVLLLGLCASPFFIQNDAWVHDIVGKQFTQIFQSAAGCAIVFKVKKINILVPSLQLEQVVVKPFDDQPEDWKWKSPSVTISISWLKLLSAGMIALYIDIKKMSAFTLFEQGKLAIVDKHINKLTQGTGGLLPLYLKSLTFKNAMLNLKHQASDFDFQAQWSSQSIKIENVFKTSINILDGQAQILHKSIITQLSGTAHCDSKYEQSGLALNINFDCTGHISDAEQKKLCSITGLFNKDHGQFALKTSDQMIRVNPIRINFLSDGVQVNCKAELPINYLMAYFNGAFNKELVHGNCTLDFQGLFNSTTQQLSGSGRTSAIIYKDMQLCNGISYSFTGTNNTWQGVVDIEQQFAQLQGAWQWDMQKSTGSCLLTNRMPCKLPFLPLWQIDAQALQMHCDFNSMQNIEFQYSCNALNKKLDRVVNINGVGRCDNNCFLTQGVVNKNKYDLQVDIAPTVQLKKFELRNQHNQELATIKTSSQQIDAYTSIIKFPLIKSLVEHNLHYTMQGQGQFEIDARIEKDKVILHTKLHDGVIRIPQTYNFINGCDFDLIFDYKQNKIIIPELAITMYQGVLQSQQAVIQLDTHYGIEHLFCPLSLKSCLLNLKKDLFATFSGELILTQLPAKMADLKGQLIIERSQLKENLFSDKFQKALFAHTSNLLDTHAYNMACDITVKTKHPIKIDTALLQSQAKVDVHIYNTIQDPKLSGMIELLGGSLIFSYSPLDIVKGMIVFSPDQFYDPTIELVAKNTIKKHNVMLQVNGSLLHHHISLESSPPLSEEQIIGLLLVGVPAQSLQSMMPAIIVQNLKTYILDSEQSPLKLNSYFKDWLKPLKNVHLIPSFNDQTSRGGLRGAIEIDINERLRALVQKNFSLSEDTRLEVEYLLSDDISVRGIRDERRDVGGEIEMRWKFGL